MALLETEGKAEDVDKDKNDDDCIDLAPKENYAWWMYTYIVKVDGKNKYFISLQWKMAGKPTERNEGSPWRKLGARNISVNGKNAKIITMNTKPHRYSDMSEYLRFKQGDKEFRYWYHKQLGSCLDDGYGVYYSLKSKNNGKMEE